MKSPTLAVAVGFGLLLSVRVSGQSDGVRVVDPQGAAIAGARVVIACGLDRRWETASDDLGRISLPDDEACRVTIDAPGFSSWAGTAAEARRLALVGLLLARVQEQVDVEAPAEPVSWMPLGAVRLGRDRTTTAWDAVALLEYAKARAGATLRADSIYVDGLPTGVIPPSTTIEEIAVNADPFSAAYSESDQNVIEIVSATPDRKFRWSSGLLPTTFGARNPLAPAMGVKHRLFDISVGGPVPRTPLTFSIDTNRSAVHEDRPVVSSPNDTAVAGLTTSAGYGVAIALIGHWSEGVRTRLSLSAGNGDATAMDVGGFVRPEAATGNRGATRDLRFGLDVGRDRYRYRTGALYSAVDTTYAAASQDAGLVILDTVTAGGAPFERMRFVRGNWLWNATVGAIDSSWLAGWSVGSERNQEFLTPNRFGRWMFGTPQEYDAAERSHRTATLQRVTGSLEQALRTTTAAAFGERSWQPWPKAIIRVGSRFDYQTGDGLLLSPRLSAQAAARGVKVQSGIGIFRQNWLTDVLMQARRYRTGAEWEIAEAWLDSAGAPMDVEHVRSEIGPQFGRPRSVVISNGIEKRGPRLSYGAEHRWTLGSKRPGSRRLATTHGWLDRLEASRRLARHQVHGRLEYAHGRTSIVGHYEWIAAYDDGDGPFSFPERQDDLAREWARSAGVSPHNVSVVVALPPLRGIGSGVMFTARSRAPLDVRTGLDVDGTRLYTDRGELPRNAGRGPGYQSLDAYASRRIEVPYLKFRGESFFIDASLSADNLLGALNAGSIGSVIASPFFGQPVTASPGRTVRVSFRVVR